MTTPTKTELTSVLIAAHGIALTEHNALVSRGIDPGDFAARWDKHVRRIEKRFPMKGSEPKDGKS